MSTPICVYNKKSKRCAKKKDKSEKVSKKEELKIYNKDTKRWVLKTGVVGKRILAKRKNPKSIQKKQCPKIVKKKPKSVQKKKQCPKKIKIDKISVTDDLSLPDWRTIRYLWTIKGIDFRYHFYDDDSYAIVSHYPKGVVDPYEGTISPNIKWYLDVLEVRNRGKGKGTQLLSFIKEKITEPILLETREGSGVFFFLSGALDLNCDSIYEETMMILNVSTIKELSKTLKNSSYTGNTPKKIFECNAFYQRKKCHICNMLLMIDDECGCT
uniref:Uncharacterized protein n=1 Tax=Marseillevirus LCMAC102 TaxID=2506603 RepID=A0A481YV26_9VIRU|nr:MAG: hypothetical protein LCMAC102_04410 [Marseillevirus LCMAC102]